jgi:aspartyl-tRNA(Asn)/glutamyl-tRNA(Gln) amidotransferase subunit A
MNEIDLKSLTIVEARRALDDREYSAVDLARAYIHEIEKRDPALHAYLEVWNEGAEADAVRADAMIAAGNIHPLTGIPIAVKDNILIEGRIASAASKILEHYTAVYDATVIAKLKEQGVVFLGRTNMDEFALGGSTENSAYGPTHNPHDESRVPGGTSGGSAAAVAGNIALAALGTDTGGSIRQPAAFCGVVGLKPTYGNVSRYGVMAAASSLDQVGPITKTIADARIMYDAIRGYDEQDSTSLPDVSNTFAATKKIGVPRSFLQKGIDADVLATFEKTLQNLADAGYEIVDIELPNLQYSLAVYYIINPAEVSTNLARYDGIRYGTRVEAATIQETYEQSRAQGFGSETRRRILTGTFVLSAGYSDAYYRKARALRELIRKDFVTAFDAVDAIALPTTPTPAFTLGSHTKDPVAMYLEDIFTVPINLAGVPAISIPCDTVERDGTQLPVGFQLIAAHRNEEILFTIGEILEQK